MANQKHLDLLKRGTTIWNRWRTQHIEVRPDLRGAYLIGTFLKEANLAGADLTGASLSRADLTAADLRGATLAAADLSKATLIAADLSKAYLSEAYLAEINLMGAKLIKANLSDTSLLGANLRGANLGGAIFTGAILTGADFSEAGAWFTAFIDVDLSTVRGLTTMRHGGPSSIGIDTIYRSQGKIPERFLRDAGIPDTLLDYMSSLVSKAIQYFTCFISHSHHDQSFCDRLYADLRHHDVPSWYFPEDAIWGKTIWGEIDQSIKLYDKLVVVCSKHSLQSSPVQREIERALQREDREGKNILFPIRLDNYLFQQWEHDRKADVISKVAGDFSGWESSAEEYDKSFQKFLEALKTSEESTKC